MYEHEFEIDGCLGRYEKVTVWVKYDAESQIRRNTVGEEEMGQVDIEIWEAKVTSYSIPGCELDRAELENLGGDGSWAKIVDGILLDHLNDAVEDDTYEYRELAEQVT